MSAILSRILASIVAFFQGVWDFITQGIYDFAVWAFAKLIEYITLEGLKFFIWALGFAWDFVKQIILELNLAAGVNSAFAAMPSDVTGLLIYFQFPQALTLVLTALVAKYVMRFIPFL